jgi:hypothetical protein
MKTFTLILSLSCMLAMWEGIFAEDDPKVGSVAAMESTWFPRVDGETILGQFIDLPSKTGGRLFVRYGSNYDSGVELERVTADGKVLWRKHVKPLGVAHSIYVHHVFVRIKDQRIIVRSEGADVIFEIRDLESGKKIFREVTPLSSANKAAHTNPLPATSRKPNDD